MINWKLESSIDCCKTSLLISILLYTFNLFFTRDLLFYPFLTIVIIYIAVLAHTSSIKFIMSTIPWLFSPTIFMVTIIAHSFCIVNFIIMPTFIFLFTKNYNQKNTFFFLKNFSLISFSHCFPVILLPTRLLD